MTRVTAARTAYLIALLFGADALVPGPAGAQPAAAGETVAEVDGAKVTLEELDRSIGEPLRRLQDQIFTLRRQQVDAWIAERLLERAARERGLSVPQLLDAEVTAKVGLVTEQEVERFYEANKARLRGAALSAVQERIRAYLQNQKLGTRRQELVQSLREGSRVVVHLTPPPITRLEVSTGGAPSKGQPAAPVTIVEFEDFLCPFCKAVQSQFAEIESRYAGRVRFVHRDFPIEELHPGASRAHEAARCAAAQDKFWPYHDLLYRNAPKVGPDDLKAYAVQTGLDLAAFDACVSQRTYRAAIAHDIEEGKRLGVTGTPTFFINGRPLTGSLPLARFVEVIEDELARAR